MTAANNNFDRYVRQIRFGPWGEDSQQKLSESTALICGCGALGSVIANTLARAGAGTLRIVDRDFLEMNNLQRQVLYDEDDVRAGLPKAIAAANRLGRINSEMTIEPIVADVNATNIEALLVGVDAIVDGTDNFETRYLLNDASHAFGVPWVYGGCIGAEGQTMTIVPGETACLRCLMPEPPPPGSTPTCDTAGILAPIINVVASYQACEVLKLLSGHRKQLQRDLLVVDMWDNRVRQVKLDSLREQNCCATCGKGEYPWLSGRAGSDVAVLCGRNSVQLTFPNSDPVDLERLSAAWSGMGSVETNRFLARLTTDEFVLTVFADGRAIIGGTDDPTEAKSIYAKFVGN